jgi:DNA-binding CsgD family transcriptional regulator
MLGRRRAQFGRHLAEGTPSATGLDALTDREREMLAWVATGRSNQEIPNELFLSPATVRTHISRAMGKLGARDRAQLVVFAVRAGLVLPEE